MQEYYYNSVTNESSWTKPEGFAGGEFVEARPTSQLRIPDTDWFEVFCENDQKYFYNESTQVALTSLKEQSPSMLELVYTLEAG